MWSLTIPLGEAVHYLARIIRIDPWHRPYEYEGTRTSFVLRSSGPDGKPNTPDDVTVTR